jgi:hypothetical protein
VGLIASVNVVLQINLEPNMFMFLGDASSKIKIQFDAFIRRNNMWPIDFRDQIFIEIGLCIIARYELF